MGLLAGMVIGSALTNRSAHVKEYRGAGDKVGMFGAAVACFGFAGLALWIAATLAVAFAPHVAWWTGAFGWFAGWAALTGFEIPLGWGIVSAFVAFAGGSLMVKEK